MECLKRATVSSTAVLWDQPLYFLNVPIGAFPAAFTDVPFVSVSLYGSDYTLITSNSPNIDNTQLVSVDGVRSGLVAGNTYSVIYSLVAKGYWK